MAKFWCVCGTLIRTSGDIPHPYQWSLVSDVDFDGYSDLVDSDEIYMKSTLMFRCPVSDHLWIFWDGMDQPPSLYSPAPPNGEEGGQAVDPDGPAPK